MIPTVHLTRNMNHPIQMVSRLFPPLALTSESGELRDGLSRSQQLMLDFGLIAHAGKGTYYLLPNALRSIEKLKGIIDHEVEGIGAYKIAIPSIADRKIWEKTGRWNSVDVLYKLKGRSGDDFCLQPTCEESVSHLVSLFKRSLSEKQLPLSLYQFSEKFRDEMKPCSGLLRTSSFQMKDLYTFDASEEKAVENYERVLEVYDRIFREHLGLNPIRIEADPGDMGGVRSHEFQLENPVGEDKVLFCKNCNEGKSADGYDELVQHKCPKCERPYKLKKTVEIGHTFLLGHRYSEALGAEYKRASDGKPAPLFMGCYGIGLTRLLAASLDSHAKHFKKLGWSPAIAPYRVYFIGPKSGSKEEKFGYRLWDVAKVLNTKHGYTGEIIWDDRTHLTIGKRLNEARRYGYPIIIVGNRTLTDPEAHFEGFFTEAIEPFDFTRAKLFYYLESCLPPDHYARLFKIMP